MNTPDKDIKDFCKQVGITPEQFKGEVPVNGNLIINRKISIPPHFTPHVKGHLDISGVTSIGEDFAPFVERSLHLWNAVTLSERFAPIVRESLDLPRVVTIPKNFAPIVGNSIYLNRVVAISDGFAPVVGYCISMMKASIVRNNFAPIAGNSIDLRGVVTIGNNFTPITGRTMNLENAKTFGKGFSPTIQGSLWINQATTLPDDFNPIVSNEVYFNDWKPVESKKLDKYKPIIAGNGKYIIADGMLAELVSKRRNVWHIKYIAYDKLFYLVSDDAGNFAHGDTLKDARDSLIYKIFDRDMSQYKGLTEDTKLTFTAAVKMYRIITGACASGVQYFVKSHNIKKKNYKIKDIIKLTTGQYGHEKLVDFFNSRK